MNYTRAELKKILGAVGENVTIHRSVNLFSPERIQLGSNVRIDCAALLSAGKDGIYIGNNVHVGAGVYLMGSGGKIILDNFSLIDSGIERILFVAS